ncbi:MAG: alkaline phosphatase family protein [Candidatus Woesearchaeota archaeon]
MKMQLPNYKDGSIVNLMSSIKKGLGGKHSYGELKLLKSKELKNTKNIVLIVIDGLGYNFLKETMRGTVFEKNLKGSITSVFPPTTGAAIPTFATGLPPQQTALAGWHVFLKEIGILANTLPFNPRIGGLPFTTGKIKIKDIYNIKGFTHDMKIKSYIIKPQYIINSDFTKLTQGQSKLIGCKTLTGFFNQITKTIKKTDEKKYIYAYWDVFDMIAHEKGIKSKEIQQYFKEICNEIEKFLKKIQNTNTKIIITSDHGFINSTKKELLKLEKHPKLQEWLTMPLTGDSRVAYCYVKANKTKQFEEYIKTKLNKYCEAYKSKDLIKKQFFGLGAPNPKLLDRIGDYTIIMKENYTIKDDVVGKKSKYYLGRHSGVSKDEMLVPLIVFDD